MLEKLCEQICHSKFTKKTSTCELCPTIAYRLKYQQQRVTGQKLGLHEGEMSHVCLGCTKMCSPGIGMVFAL